MSADAAQCSIQGSPKKKVSSVLTRDDFDSGPVSVDKIEDNLYLGNLKAASDLKALKELNITHILTVDAVPLPRFVSEKVDVVLKYIQVADVPKEDMISHFLETNAFIKMGQENGTVLVHCYYGMSRSSTVVIAYIMAKYGLCFNDALAIVKYKRGLTCPNPGFMKQLKLYSEMGCVLDKDNPQYKQFRLKMASEKVRKVKILPQDFSDLVKADPSLTREKPDPLVYRCRKCRRIVASQSNIIPHIPKPIKVEMVRRNLKLNGEQPKKCNMSCVGSQDLAEKLRLLTCSDSDLSERRFSIVSSQTEDNTDRKSSTATQSDLKNESLSGGSNVTALRLNLTNDPAEENTVEFMEATSADAGLAAEVCKQTYFVEPMTWMEGVQHNVQGKLHCPKCHNKIGSFSWVMGCRCPCGQKVAPAFYLVPSKVEWSNVVQNVQMTV